jgi:ring-1,2-phenylacetyl-CoA epoxidase subunit PaaD
MKTITDKASILELLNKIPDPEVPAISIVELGVVRDVEVIDDKVIVSMTPTYNGCPALNVMEQQVREALLQEGFQDVEIKRIYKPAWTTDWMSDEVKEKLRSYGIAPPAGKAAQLTDPFRSSTLSHTACPFCGSEDTTLTSRFGSTACKSLHFCNNCHQPFEHFKCH